MTYDPTKYTDRLSALRFFPVKAQAVAAIAEMLIEICSTEAEMDESVTAAIRRFSEWPGPAKLRELHESEVASKRPRQAEPEGCERCRTMGGLRRAFQVVGPEGKEIIWPEGDGFKVEREVHARYANSKTHQVYDIVAPCSCPLGLLRREEYRKVASQGQRR